MLQTEFLVGLLCPAASTVPAFRCWRGYVPRWRTTVQAACAYFSGDVLIWYIPQRGLSVNLVPPPIHPFLTTLHRQAAECCVLRLKLNTPSTQQASL